MVGKLATLVRIVCPSLSSAAHKYILSMHFRLVFQNFMILCPTDVCKYFYILVPCVSYHRIQIHVDTPSSDKDGVDPDRLKFQHILELTTCDFGSLHYMYHETAH